MIQYYKLPLMSWRDKHCSGGISMIYIIGDILYVYDFERRVHCKCTNTIAKRCETVDAVQFVERGAYGTTTTVHSYLEEYKSEEEYLQEIEKYVMMKELVG